MLRACRLHEGPVKSEEQESGGERKQKEKTKKEEEAGLSYSAAKKARVCLWKTWMFLSCAGHTAVHLKL